MELLTGTHKRSNLISFCHAHSKDAVFFSLKNAIFRGGGWVEVEEGIGRINGGGK